MAENDHPPLTWHIALTTVYTLTCYNVITFMCVKILFFSHGSKFGLLLLRNDDSRRHVTYFRGIVNNLVAVVAYNGNVIS